MAYTDKDAIYEIAEKLGYTGDEGLTTTEAVYAVAAALGYTGEHDKSVALALSDLKTVVGGGGGGDLGALQPCSMVAWENQPTVNSPASDATYMRFESFDVDGQNVLAAVDESEQIDSVKMLSAGLTCTFILSDSDFDTASAYLVTLDESYNYQTVTPWSGSIIKNDSQYEGAHSYTFTMPELQEGVFLVFWPHIDGGGNS